VIASHIAMLQYENRKGFIMKNYEFSKSLQVAISFLFNFTEATKSWKNFIWFHEIIPGQIILNKTCLSEGTASKYKKIKRAIYFHGYKNKQIARVFLEGNEFTSTDQSKQTFWKVVEVHYVNNYDESRTFLNPEWTKVKIEEKDQVLM
jgi:hypothetical protein